MPTPGRRERVRIYQRKIELRKLVESRVITTAELELLLAAYADQRLRRKQFQNDWS